MNFEKFDFLLTSAHVSFFLAIFCALAVVIKLFQLRRIRQRWAELGFKPGMVEQKRLAKRRFLHELGYDGPMLVDAKIDQRVKRIIEECLAA